MSCPYMQLAVFTTGLQNQLIQILFIRLFMNQSGNSWRVGWIEEMSRINCQKLTRAELNDSLRQTIEESLGFR